MTDNELTEYLHSFNCEQHPEQKQSPLPQRLLYDKSTRGKSQGQRSDTTLP